ncbi:methyl-accepting chemotaxis protein [Nibricoccus sp. IMCC34717]|uniref:methyl-accepting chemotaxis protein n=1 Tax=Nibricoccus sp. IMCC34717 TaxID=3034021 RepID=UPI00384FAA9E
MKIHVKLLLSILVSLALVYGLIVTANVTWQGTFIKRLAAENLQKEEGNEWRAIENLRRACNAALKGAMEEGEMDQFRRLLDAQKEVHGLQELTIFDKDGVAAESTLPAVKKTKLPQPVVDRFQKDATPWRERTDDSFILFQPMPVTDACIECHKNYKGRVTGGIYRYRFSTEELRHAEAKWVEFSDDLRRRTWLNGLWSALGLMLVAGVVITWIVRRQIARPLDSVSEALGSRVDEVAETAESINSTSQELAQGSQSQAAALEESSAAVEETTSMARRTASDASQAMDAATATRTAVEHAKSAMEQMNTRMAGIQQATGDVGKILKTIDEIAFQTNLLALNAAVEAARAGEAGAGFAVVADEVRSLAQRCATAARSTAELTAQVTTQVSEGATLSSEVVKHLADINARVETEERLVRQIAQAAKEQETGLSQINTSVSSIDQVTQKNAGLSEEAAKAAEELFQESAALRDSVHALLRLLHGHKHASTPPPAADSDSEPSQQKP